MALIEITNLSRVYKKGGFEVSALKDASLNVEPGEFVSIVGKSGSGKSTLMNLIGGLDSPTSGKIIFDGTDLATMTRKELALHRRFAVGMIFQSFNLIKSLVST
jgi:putative ABC transport system ATP-binding protein